MSQIFKFSHINQFKSSADVRECLYQIQRWLCFEQFVGSASNWETLKRWIRLWFLQKNNPFNISASGSDQTISIFFFGFICLSIDELYFNVSQFGVCFRYWCYLSKTISTILDILSHLIHMKKNNAIRKTKYTAIRRRRVFISNRVMLMLNACFSIMIKLYKSIFHALIQIGGSIIQIALCDKVNVHE